MAARPAAARAAAPGALLSIGQVLAKLAAEFPDLTPSKLRFLEEQRLVRPARTPSGYRKFCAEDIERLRLVLSLQRDKYLPLKVIREYLADLDAGREPSLPGGAPERGVLGSGRRLGREELLRESRASAALLGEAIAASLVVPGESYGEDALAMMNALVALQGRGIEPRHLRGLRASVARDLGLIDSALASARRPHDASGRAHDAEEAQELAETLGTVRGLLLRGGLARMTS